VFVADALGTADGLPVVLPDPATDSREAGVPAQASYHRELRRTLRTATGTSSETTDSGTVTTSDGTNEAAVELLVVDGRARPSLEGTPGTAVNVEPSGFHRPGRFRRFLRRIVY
jgi:hypothetical protein